MGSHCYRHQEEGFIHCHCRGKKAYASIINLQKHECFSTYYLHTDNLTLGFRYLTLAMF